MLPSSVRRTQPISQRVPDETETEKADTSSSSPKDGSESSSSGESSLAAAPAPAPDSPSDEESKDADEPEVRWPPCNTPLRGRPRTPVRETGEPEGEEVRAMFGPQDVLHCTGHRDTAVLACRFDDQLTAPPRLRCVDIRVSTSPAQYPAGFIFTACQCSRMGSAEYLRNLVAAIDHHPVPCSEMATRATLTQLQPMDRKYEEATDRGAIAMTTVDMRGTTALSRP
ncbi:hypothetical protein F4815DRAFT_445093 [Daldinia loculata]|nr:hypothetical protein F4815DRAFT_445093 [Daldinia loculata]